MTKLAIQLIEREKAEKTGTLDLGRTGLTTLNEIAPQLMQLTHLKTLIVSNRIRNRAYPFWHADAWTESQNTGPFNLLRGQLPDGFFTAFPNLERLYIGGTGDIKRGIKVGAHLYNWVTIFRDFWNFDFEAQKSNFQKLQLLDIGYNSGNIEEGFLAGLKSLKTLYLRSNQISDYSFLSSLTNIQTLDLSGNQISDISFLSSLTNIQTLDLRSNQISDISFLSSLTNIQTLDLSGNQISDYSFLSSLTNIQTLYLSGNQISDYSFLSSLTNIQTLYLSGNQISDYSFLSSLTNIQTLDLRSNQISDISFLSSLTNIQTLDLRSNQISDISFLSSLTNIQTLDLSYNQISDISFLSSLTNIQTLYLSGNQISDYSFLSSLTNIQTLDLSSNQISDISFLSSLTNIQTLDLSYNQISDISFLSSLTNIQTLDLSYNQISDISFLSSLTNIQTLDLRSNQISDISFLSSLTNIQTLYLRSNQISDISAIKELIQKIPIVWDYLESGKINIQDNPLEIPPPEVVKQGNAAVLAYLEKLEEEGREYLYEAKLLIVGEARVGKSTLLERLKDENAAPLPEEASTHGIQIEEKPFTTSGEEPQLTAHIWDFGGQEIYRATHQFFLTRRSLYILVDDASRDDTRLSYWMRKVALLSDRSRVFLVQNQRGDRLKDINLGGLMRDFFDMLKLKQQKEVYAFNFHWNDSKGDQNAHLKRMRKFWREVQKEMKKMDMVGMALPKSWSKVRKEMQALESKKPYISQEEYFMLCKQEGIKEREEQLKLSELWHDLGVFLHFREDPILKHYVILQNEWATDAVYKIFDDEKVKRDKGLFLHAQASEIWSESKFCHMHDFLLKLMQNFELCYEIKSSGKRAYLVPQLLPVQQPKYDFPTKNNLHVRYRYESYMPEGLLSRLMVRMNRYITQRKEAWREGVVLHRNNGKAEVVEKHQSIEIRAHGKHAKELMTLITEEIDQMHERFGKELEKTLKKLVPCNCRTCRQRAQSPNKSEESNFYEYSDLMRRKERGKATIECKYSYEDRNVLRLLDDTFVTNFFAPKPVKVFISYSKADEAYLEELKKHLKTLTRQGELLLWDDQSLKPGEKWDQAIKGELLTADVILVLLSADALATDYIYDVEMKMALERHRKGRTMVVPVILRPCMWKHTSMSMLSALPRKGEPIANHDNKDAVWKEVAEGIKEAAQQIRAWNK